MKRVASEKVLYVTATIIFVSAAVTGTLFFVGVFSGAGGSFYIHGINALMAVMFGVLNLRNIKKLKRLRSEGADEMIIRSQLIVRSSVLYFCAVLFALTFALIAGTFLPGHELMGVAGGAIMAAAIVGFICPLVLFRLISVPIESAQT